MAPLPQNRFRVFWVEPTGRWRANIWRKDAPAIEALGDFDSEELAEAASRPLWDAGLLDHSSRSPLYRLPDGREVTSHELPPGAMYHNEHGSSLEVLPDGVVLTVVGPGLAGTQPWHWNVDSRASNCDLPNDTHHHCWCRHGDPRTGWVHVDKIPEPGQATCGAGAGSIWYRKDQPGDFHGYLHDGILKPC